MTDFSLYYAALRADERFSEALIAAYGEKEAPNARYYRAHTDPEVIASRAAKHAADALWLAEMRKASESP